MKGKKEFEETEAERKARMRQERRARKKRARMPIHGASLRKIPEIWHKRSEETKREGHRKR